MAKRWLTVDPGEDTGYAIWEDDQLIYAGTEKLWAFAHSLFTAMFRPEEIDLVDDEAARRLVGIERIVCEDFRIYPWEAKKGSLDWDQVRTARLIGALTLIAQVANLEWVLQPAKIKKSAEEAGAAELFLFPRDENRHANDAIRHGVYWLAVKQGMKAIPMEHDDKALVQAN